MFTFAVPAVMFFGLAVWICWRSYGLRVLHAVLAACFGYYVGASRVGPVVGGVVHAAVTGLMHMVGG